MFDGSHLQLQGDGSNFSVAWPVPCPLIPDFSPSPRDAQQRFQAFLFGVALG